jgi:hypothetical protein
MSEQSLSFKASTVSPLERLDAIAVKFKQNKTNVVKCQNVKPESLYDLV